MWDNILFICAFVTLIFLFVLIMTFSLSFFTKFKGKKTDKILRFSFLMFFIFYFFTVIINFLLQPPKSDIATRIENVSTSLTDISTEIEDIQSELTQRIELVAELKKEAEIAENMISLSDDQVTAIQAKLRQELDSNSGKNFVQGILINGLFFILGFIFPRIINSFKRKSTKTGKPTTASSNPYSEEEIAQAIELLDTVKKDKK